MRAAVYIALAILCSTLGASAQDVHVDVQSTQVTVGAPFAFRVTAQGERVARPVIPHADGLTINRTPNNTGESIQIQFSGGQSVTVRKKEWVYYATPQREGDLTLPAIEVLIDGVNQKSAPVALHARAEAVPQAQPAQPQQGAAQQAPNNPPADASSWPELAAFVESEVDKREAYQGESVVMTLRIGQLLIDGVQVAGPRNIDLPETEGFYSTSPQQEEKREKRNGYTYKVNTITQTLYPLRTGRLTIGRFSWMPARAYRYVRGSLLREEAALDLRTPPIYIDVKPLPNPPPEFTGAVGRFRMTAALASHEAEQGEPVDLVVRISGEGNPNAIGAPELPDLPWAHVSGPELDLVDTGGGRNITKTFRYIVTPLEVGAFEVPPIPFAYFEPNAGGFRNDNSQGMTLNVTPSSLPLPMEQPAVPAAGAQTDDIWSIEHTAAHLHSRNSSATGSMAVVAFPPFAWVGFFLYMRRKRRLETDTAYARDIQARAKSRKRLNHITNANEPLQEVYRAIAEYLADKFNVEGAGLTAQDAERLLHKTEAPQELTQALLKVMRACERERYAGVAHNAQEVNALAHAAETHLDSLEAHLRGRHAK